MSFKAVITEGYTEIQGTTEEILAGLICYIKGLQKTRISNKTIKETVNLALNDKDIEETVLDNDKVQIQLSKFNLNNMTKEESKELLAKEIFKLFD